MKYALTIDKSNEENNQFVLLDDNDSKFKTILIKKIEKLSKFKDHSWEIEVKGKKCFRFKSLNEEENAKIYDTMDKLINQKIDEAIENFSVDKETENSPETNLWSLKIDSDITSSNLLKKFILDNVYLLKIENEKLVLENESNKINSIDIPYK